MALLVYLIGTYESKKGHLDTPSIFYNRSSNDQHDKYTSQSLKSVSGVSFKENEIKFTTSTSTSIQLPSLLLPTSPTTPSSQGLSESHVLICQNIEIFSATIEDFENFRNVTEGGLASEIGQIGLRCIYCGQSPFAKAELSVTFPGCLNSVSLCVLQMNATHFPKCMAMPKAIKERLQSLKASRSEGDHLRTFCLDVFKELGLCNREPSMSGIVITKLPLIETPMKDPLHPSTLQSPLRGSTHGRQVLQHLEQYQNHPNELFFNVPAKIPVDMKAHEEHPFPSNHKWNSPYRNSISSHWKHLNTPSPTIRFDDWSPTSSKRLKRDMAPLLAGAIDTACTAWEDHATKISLEAYSKEDSAQMTQVSMSLLEDHATTHAKKERAQMIQDSILLLQQRLTMRPTMEHLHDGDRVSMDAFFFYVMKQFHPCTFTVEQMQSRRISHVNPDSVSELEYVGLQCIHCTSRKYLWLANKSFRSCLTRLSKHAVTCAASPKAIRDALQVLHDNPIEKKTQKKVVLNRLWGHLVRKVDEPLNMSILQDKPSDFMQVTSSKVETRAIPYYPASTLPRLTHSGVVENTKHRLLFPEDKDLLTPFVFRVMNFLERCTFSPDQNSRRSETPIGFAGLRCTVCVKRCFYWSSPHLFTNSFSDVTKHVRTCPKLPLEVRTELNALFETHHNDIRKLPRGAQAVFFRRLWTRLHGQDVEFKSDSSNFVSDLRQVDNQEEHCNTAFGILQFVDNNEGCDSDLLLL